VIEVDWRLTGLVDMVYLQCDEEDIALHGTDATRRHDTLGLAERTQERLAGPDVRLGQTRFKTLEAVAV